MTIATQPVPKRIPPGHEHPEQRSAIPADDDHEQVVIRQDPDTGLRFIVAVHSTVLGPSLGGMRVKRYPGGLHEALEDVMGLARTMSLKASAAGLDLGDPERRELELKGKSGKTEVRVLRLSKG